MSATKICVLTAADLHFIIIVITSDKYLSRGRKSGSGTKSPTIAQSECFIGEVVILTVSLEIHSWISRSCNTFLSYYTSDNVGK